MDVVAVEPGPKLAAISAARYPAADLLLSRAEDIESAKSASPQVGLPLL